MATAETPAELIAALRMAVPAPAEPTRVHQEIAGPSLTIPVHAATLVDLLEAHAQTQPAAASSVHGDGRECGCGPTPPRLEADPHSPHVSRTRPGSAQSVRNFQGRQPK
jgi:hypothetical protein